MAIKGKYLSQEYDKYFYRGKRLTPKQKEWNEEVRKALDRSESWVRKFHAVAEVPQKPAEVGKKVTAKALKGLKEFRHAPYTRCAVSHREALCLLPLSFPSAAE